MFLENDDSVIMDMSNSKRDDFTENGSTTMPGSESTNMLSQSLAMSELNITVYN